MRIMIVGVGKVGFTLAEHLTTEGHDVVVVDQSDAALRKCEDTLDVLCVSGNGAVAQTLQKGEIDHTDILIAATATDEINMLCCLIGKRLGAKYTIARIRDPQYNENLSLFEHELGIDLTINPERATAIEIGRLLRLPFASSVETFAHGLVEMVGFRAQIGDAFVGIPLKEVRNLNLPQVLYAAVERDGQALIPNGDFVIEPSDHVFVISTPETISAFFRVLGKNTKPVKRAMILGGGRVSYYLARRITSGGTSVSLIEINPDKARRLKEDLSNVNVIQGDGTSQELLEQEGLRDMDAFICLSDRDEENLMTGLFAIKQGVKKVVVKNNHISYADIMNDLGLDNIVSPRQITSSTILRYVRAVINSHGTKIDKLYRILGGKAEAMEFEARPGASYIGIPLHALKKRPNTLVGMIVRKRKPIVPFGDDTIEAGDRVVILACESGISDLNEVISK
ncbi:MAG: Trk system potassium transporter TrkA [Clostridia bacterium]|nr:Trk system potassium transporter TrkA [Clostridia bacterium]